ncbi:MAG: hypothetical protein BGO41_01930 [Clostridiales bacterium 38-18]|nr:MAG: hypothetical protein BGO41_01930 [Clostridiales bacterium 38-18]
MKLNREVQTLISRFDSLLSGAIEAHFSDIERTNASNRAIDIVKEGMNYSLLAGGKRIRPMILLEMATAYGAELKTALEFAIAIEMIHTYSLIHDDLPSMDNDDLRRGKPTNHVVFGEDMAILSGDALLNLASELMINASISLDSPEKGLRAMYEILQASGSKGMILGQVADIKYHEGVIDREALDFINANKTGKLLKAAVLAGAILGRADDAELFKLKSIGEAIGLLFQLVDDILDVVGDESKIGKRTQIDLQNEKCTYPALLGLEQTRAYVSELEQSILMEIDKLSCQSDFLRSLVLFLSRRDY